MHSITRQKKAVFIATAVKKPRRNAWKKSL